VTTAIALAFQRANPCPSTGFKTGACPGYVARAKAKDWLEAAECRAIKRNAVR
jgi:hypothetical protein